MEICTSHFRCILKCALDISCLEMEVYTHLLKKPGMSVDDLANSVNKDKSTVYKALQNLTNKGLVLREYRILRGGGYKYIYKPTPFSNLKKTISNSLDNWIQRISELLNEVEKLERQSELLRALQ